jgi:hypothetical protein
MSAQVASNLLEFKAMSENWRWWLVAVVIPVAAFLFAHFVTPDLPPFPGN